MTKCSPSTTLPYVHITGLNSPAMNCCHQWIDGFAEDAIRVMGSGKIFGNTIIDLGENQGHHRDAIQLIPTGSWLAAGKGWKQVLQRAQFAGGLLSDVDIRQNHIRSDGHLQGVFCSDGLLKNITVVENQIQTKGQHSITLSGLLSGTIADNYGSNGVPCPVRLYPLRIGGNPGGKNMWVSSFANRDKYEYQPPQEIIQNFNPDYHHDQRSSTANKQSVYLQNFDLDGFLEFVTEQPMVRNAAEWCLQLQRWAVGFADQERGCAA